MAAGSIATMLSKRFNADKSFKQFLTEQIAGDELFDWRNAKQYTPDQIEKLIATGFLRTAEDPTDNAERDTPLLRYEVIHQTLDILTSSVMGVTVGCARCHNHKFDPIPQKDYYSLMATLTPAYNPVSGRRCSSGPSPMFLPPRKRRLTITTPRSTRQSSRRRPSSTKLYEKSSLPLIEEALVKVDAKDRALAKKAALLPETKRNARQKNLVAALGVDLSPEADPRSHELQRIGLAAEALEAEIASLEKQRKSYATLEALYDDRSRRRKRSFIAEAIMNQRARCVEPAGLEVLSRPARFSRSRPHGPPAAASRWRNG